MYRKSKYTASCKHSKMGKQKDYSAGDISVWMGNNPAIIRIKRKCGTFNDSYIAVDGRGYYSSCSYHFLRPATKRERDILKSDDVVLINLSKTPASTPKL